MGVSIDGAFDERFGALHGRECKRWRWACALLLWRMLLIDAIGRVLLRSGSDPFHADFRATVSVVVCLRALWLSQEVPVTAESANVMHSQHRSGHRAVLRMRQARDDKIRESISLAFYE